MNECDTVGGRLAGLAPFQHLYQVSCTEHLLTWIDIGEHSTGRNRLSAECMAGR